jgi:hypothetical protein
LTSLRNRSGDVPIRLLIRARRATGSPWQLRRVSPCQQSNDLEYGERRFLRLEPHRKIVTGFESIGIEFHPEDALANR